jgi:hypothetical protein
VTSAFAAKNDGFAAVASRVKLSGFERGVLILDMRDACALREVVDSSSS